MYNAVTKQGDVMFKKLAKRLKSEYMEHSFVPSTSPLKDDLKNPFLKSQSKHALSLYERENDINNFTKLVLSNPENESHNQLVKNLFDSGDIKDVMSEESLFELSENKRFLEDLGL